jgi:hypothetical protein
MAPTGVAAFSACDCPIGSEWSTTPNPDKCVASASSGLCEGDLIVACSTTENTCRYPALKDDGENCYCRHGFYEIYFPTIQDIACLQCPNSPQSCLDASTLEESDPEFASFETFTPVGTDEKELHSAVPIEIQ